MKANLFIAIALFFTMFQSFPKHEDSNTNEEVIEEENEIIVYADINFYNGQETIN